MPVVTLEQVRAVLNLGSDTSHDTELEIYIDAAEAHLTAHGVVLDETEFTEDVRWLNGHIITRYWPVLTVTELADDFGSSYTTDFTIGDAAFSVEHDSVSVGDYRITYTAGYAAIPADLKLAVLEDIRGLYQPGQIGPPASFGAFGAENTDFGPTYRPVRMWPRVDAWIDSRVGPAIA